MHTWQDGYVETNGIRLHYWRTGGDKPPVVCLHGVTDSGLCWLRVARVLEADYDLILVDQRGHGQSDKPEGDYTIEQLAADAAGLIEALGIGPTAVMGHSLGGGVSTALGATRPDLVRCLVLEDPPWRIPGSPRDQAQPQRLRDWREETRIRKETMSLDDIIAQGKATRPTWSDEEFEPWARAKLDVTERVFDGLASTLNRWETWVPQLQCPTLLIGGESESAGNSPLNGIIGPEVAERACALNPRVQFVKIPGAGHNVRREGFEAFLQTVKPFLAQHAR